ncbi:MAG: ABC transporter ATP-binding protein [Alphaproteobacteria bacterium]|nr:ABC transporter ATP-binding protein [Alphaproteobacteria bacterium]
MTAISLQISGLVCGYGAMMAVQGVDLEVRRGEITALLGSNGAGKSTTLRAISGLLPLSGGTIHLDGQDITPLRADQRVDRGIVMVPEGRLIFPQMTVEENLRVGAFAPRARRAAAKSLDHIYGLFPRLAERRRQAGGTLSGGEQQMLALGRGLMARPEVLLLDEPSLGLAPIMAGSMFDAVETLKQEGLTILIAEQDVGRTLALASTAYVIENGRIAMTGTGADLLQDPQIKVAYLGL